MSNYNQEKYIEQAIESVLAQKTDFAWQLIITDDHSTKDKSVEIIQKYEQKYPDKIKALYNQTNGRYLQNILRAKSITKTPYFCLLDADDFWTDLNYLQDAVNFLDTHPDFTIYSRNVVCLQEDGTKDLFIPSSVPASDFSLENYFQHAIYITQTTGSFFRNVIFSKGIPPMMQQAVGTISERSFEGDFDRYIMHLKYGKAHYEPKPSGVYRILSCGIWTNLKSFQKKLIQAQCLLDYNRYFDYKYHDFFINEAYQSFLSCLQDIQHLDVGDISGVDPSCQLFFRVLENLNKNKNVIHFHTPHKPSSLLTSWNHVKFKVKKFLKI